MDFLKKYKSLISYSLLVGLLLLFYLPGVLGKFAYHNDLRVFEYDASLGQKHIEYYWLIIIGRYVGAVLLNFQFSFINQVSDFSIMRGLSLATLIICAVSSLYLFNQISKKKLLSLVALIVGLTTTSFQVNLLWASNWVPGTLTLVLAILAYSIFNKFYHKSQYTAFALGCVLMIVGMYMYPPTMTFFLVFAFINYLENKDTKQLLLTIAALGLSMVLYYAIHRLSLYYVIRHNYSVLYNALLSTRYNMEYSIFDSKITDKLVVLGKLIWNSLNLSYLYAAESKLFSLQIWFKALFFGVILLDAIKNLRSKDFQALLPFGFFITICVTLFIPFLASKSEDVILYRAFEAVQFLAIYYFLFVLSGLLPAKLKSGAIVFFGVILFSTSYVNYNNAVSFYVNQYKTVKGQLIAQKDIIAAYEVDPKEKRLLKINFPVRSHGFPYQSKASQNRYKLNSTDFHLQQLHSSVLNALILEDFPNFKIQKTRIEILLKYKKMSLATASCYNGPCVYVEGFSEL